MPTNSLDIPKKPEDTRIVVAMSGGVDSSVVAAMLKQQGYDVVGITLQLYDQSSNPKRPGSCCAGQDIDDARRVANIFNFPHYVLNYETRFKNAVIDPFAESYLRGETPIPCVACNQTVKFSDLLNTARELKADALATGHYIVSKQTGPHRRLYQAFDKEKDQSYFLFATTQEQLDFLRFPLGNISKKEVREIAKKLGLSISEKQDSQDICFVTKGKYSDLVSQLRPQNVISGDIIHLNGETIGKHRGIINYTIGQRKGIGVGAGEPLYVISIDTQKKRIIVGPRESLKSYSLFLKDINWLGDQPISEMRGQRFDLHVKIRSTHDLKPAQVFFELDGKIRVNFLDGEEAVSPGQACVFYSKMATDVRILGGGFIVSTRGSAAVEEQLLRLNS